MNPSSMQLAMIADRDAHERRINQEHRARLHKAAVERRRKRKRGGRK